MLLDTEFGCFSMSKSFMAVGKSPNCHLQKTSCSTACSEVLQLRKGGEVEKLPVLKQLES